ncbi:MAG: glycosyltransferase family 39 protein [Candidatus Omnitrophica bacterium]|nr:glycosyltransferase family 39 protein [Candidatus Omnitrophota bacterium]
MKNNYIKRIIGFSYAHAALFLLAFGLFLRLNHFFENRSFWLDEAYVALNLTHLSLKDILLFVPFLGPQASPPMLFLFTEKLFMLLLGNNEIVLRAFPVLCSVLSLVLFYFFCIKYLNKKSLLLVLSVFVLSEPLIYYAAELKPYSTDLLFSLILYLSFPFKKENILGFKEILFLGGLGSISIFFSYPSVFILASIGLILLIRSVTTGKKTDPIKVLIICFWWLLNVFFLYSVAIKTLFKDDALVQIINLANFFPAVPFTSLENTALFIKCLFKNMISPLGIMPLSLWTIITCLGIVNIFQKDKEKFFLFAAPIFLALAASLVQKYPFVPRFLIFLVPSYLLFLSAGIETLFRQPFFSRRSIKLAIIIVLLFQPLQDMTNSFINGREDEDTRSIMQQFQKNYKKGDAIFLNRHAIYGFGYYRGVLKMGEENLPMLKIVFNNNNNEKQYSTYVARYFFNKDGFLSGFLEDDNLLKDSAKIMWRNNPSTWVILTHIKENDKEILIHSLNEQGKMKISYEAKGAYLYLYDLSDPK